MRKIHLASLFAILVSGTTQLALYAQTNVHPHLYFDRAGMDSLRARVLSNPRLNKIWQEFKADRVDTAMNVTVTDGPISDLDTGRDYGDALADLTMAYVVLRDPIFLNKAKQIALALARKSSWGEQLSIAHISIGLAFCWDVMYDHFSSRQKTQILDGVRSNANNQINNNPLVNHNWTPSAGEGLIGLAFQGDGSSLFNSFAAKLLASAKRNFKEGPENVLWAHGADGFSPQGLGYWRKYNHMALFLHALRFNEPQNDWYRLGKEYPGSKFLANNAYPRIYADVQHPDLACLTWGDSRQVRSAPEGPFGSIGMLTLAASEYKDGYVMDFIDYLIEQTGFRFEDEDMGTFIFYDDEGVPNQSYRDLPLSGYWPNMEGAIFRSGWDKNDIIFFMRCGSPLGHARQLKGLPSDKHSHPDANGFVLFYNNDYLAAEDGGKPRSGPDTHLPVTYGHNTILIDGKGQKGDKSPTLNATMANLDFLDAEHIGFLLGDATDAYPSLDRFYRYVIYKKDKYFIMVDELKDDTSHKYEFLLGTDARHIITPSTDNKFYVRPQDGSAELPVVFVEPKGISSSITQERHYSIVVSMVDLLRVAPAQNTRNTTFFTLLYPRKTNDPEPSYTKIYDGGRSGILVDGNEVHLYNDAGTRYTYGNATTDAKLCYFKDDPNAFEYLAAGSREFLYQGVTGIRSNKLLVAAFKGTAGKIRLGKNLGEAGEATITLFHPRIIGVIVDGQSPQLIDSGSGYITFNLSPKQYQTGPTGFEQTVTDNYDVQIVALPPPASVQLTSPNGGEGWKVDGNQTILWTSEGTLPAVKLEYSLDNGSSWLVVTDSTDNDGLFNWIIPDTLSDSVLVRISDVSDGEPSDISDNVFAIIETPPRITTFDPTSGPIGAGVTISGSHFSRITDVRFNGFSAASFSVLSDTKAWATVPTGATTGKISVHNSAGSSISANDFAVAVVNGETIVLPKEDTYVGSSGPWESNGSKVTLLVEEALLAKYRAYFKFKIAGLRGEVQTAKLRLFVNDGSSDGGAIYAVSNSYEGTTVPWNEVDLTWDTAPQLTGDSLNSLTTVAVGTTVEFDVTAAINGDGEYSLAIKNHSSDLVSYASKESSQPPQLLILTGPAIMSFSPTSGEVGTEITIAGRHFTGATDVKFNQVPAAFSVVADTLILATVPDSATTGKIAVTAPVGTTMSDSTFTVTIPPPPKPVVAGFIPTSGPVGTEVTVSGRHFTDATDVKFNQAPAAFSVVADTLILTTVPDSATTGKIAVTVPVGTTMSDSTFTVTIPPPPKPVVAGFIPTSGPVGTEVTISGRHFTDATDVKFNQAPAAFSAVDDTLILATVPDSATIGKIAVTTPAGTALSDSTFTVTVAPLPQPVVVGFAPTSGPVGTEVTISGRHFTGATDVKFNQAPATFSAVDDTLILATVPDSATIGKIAVTTPAGTTLSDSAFTVTVAPLPQPVIARFTPTSGPVGTEVTISGRHFTGATDVKFNQAPAAFSAVADTLILATVPDSATIGKIAVTTPAGTALSDSAFTVTVTPPPKPVIARFTPTSGPAGTEVTISGRHFTGATYVKFNQAPAAFSAVGDTLILATVPDSATIGKIAVTTPAGTALSDSTFTVTVAPLPQPVVSGFTPTSGPVGTEVTISGRHFTGATDVKFNQVAAAFSAVDDTLILATVPDSATTGKISVIRPTGGGHSDKDFVVTSDGGTKIQAFTPTDDAFVWSRQPTENYGSAADLSVSQSTENRIAYLKFPVSGLSGGVVNAKLRLLCTDGSPDGGAVYSVPNDFQNNSGVWTEDGLTWQTAPAVNGSAALSSVGAVNPGQTVEFEVTEAIVGNGVYSFAVKNGSSDLLQYSAKEGAAVPELIIETSTVTSVDGEGTDNSDDRSKTGGETSGIPRNPVFAPNYPNPFNRETTLKYSLPEATKVRLVIYNIKGREVRTLVDAYQSTGFKTVRWNGRNNSGREVSSGVYLARLSVGPAVLTRKLILQK